MARREQFSMGTNARRRRRFSDNFKREKVRELELGLSRPCDILRQYQITNTTLYRWIATFGSMKKDRKERMIVETESDTRELLSLKQRIMELERMIGQKQIQLEFTQKMIELAEEYYEVDIKKKFSTTPSSTSGDTEKKSPGV